MPYFWSGFTPNRFNLSAFYGLRDFIQLLHFLRQKFRNHEEISDEVLLKALVRNFGGQKEKDFSKVAERFFFHIYQVCDCIISPVFFSNWWITRCWNCNLLTIFLSLLILSPSLLSSFSLILLRRDELQSFHLSWMSSMMHWLTHASHHSRMKRREPGTNSSSTPVLMRRACNSFWHIVDCLASLPHSAWCAVHLLSTWQPIR